MSRAAVTVAAGYSKRRREDSQPLRADLAGLLCDWLADKPRGQRVFATMPGNTAECLRSDLEAARAAWYHEAKANPVECEAPGKVVFSRLSQLRGGSG